MLRLPTWGRWAMIGGAVGIVLLSVIIVVCIVAPGCCLNRLFLNDEEEEKKKRKKKPDGIFYESQTLCGVISGSPSKELKDGVDRSDSVLSQSSGSVCSKLSEKSSFPSVETSSLLSSFHDSTYSSMSENSGRTSPTVSCSTSSVGGSVKSGHASPICEDHEPQGQLNFGLQYISNTHDINMGKLVITVLEAGGLPGKEYLDTTCDAYVKVVVWKERRSLRKHKSPALHAFRTRTVRHTRSPTFNQSFIIDVDKTQLKDLVVKLTVMDNDKWASPTCIGEVIQPLRDIKNLATIDTRTTLNYSMALPKLDLGEVLLGLSYLPTAQRLTVSIVKANNLRFQNLVEELGDFNPFVRVMLIGSSGRLLKKKKTSWRSATNSPVWNETLIFDITQSQMEQVTFILVLCTRPQLPVTPDSCEVDSYQSIETLPDLSLSSEDSGGPEHHKKDKYLGKIVLGCGVRGEESRTHWTGVLANPRKVASHWHALK